MSRYIALQNDNNNPFIGACSMYYINTFMHTSNILHCVDFHA